MRNAHVPYLCFPSVVCVGKETEITVFPRDTSRIFRPEWEYHLGVYGLGQDNRDYIVPLPLDLDFTVTGGCLKFRYTFTAEQAYSIRFCREGEKEIRLQIYAVEEDLYQLRPLKGDLHTHCYYSDGLDGMTMVPANYREEGFDFFSLTDHNRNFTSRLVAGMLEKVGTDLHLVTGEEIHTPGSALHIVGVGARESVCEKYIHDPETFRQEVQAIEDQCGHIPQQYRHRMAMAKWACSQVQALDGIAIFAHPYWQPNQQNISDEFCQLLFQEHIFDAFEVMGGIDTFANNMQLALWQEQCARGNSLTPVGSSDSHNHDREKTSFACRFTLVFARENTTPAILEAIRAGLCVAADVPQTDNNEVRFYGPWRLVRFSHFLYQHYFNETWQLCIGEGNLLRRYAQGEDVGPILASLQDSVPAFYRRFYGLDAAPTLPAWLLDFLDEALHQQRTLSPVTRGAHLIRPNNPRRE